MFFKSVIEGNVIDKKFSKKGKPYILIYDGNNLVNVFCEDSNNFKIGESVKIPCTVFVEKAFVKQEI